MPNLDQVVKQAYGAGAPRGGHVLAPIKPSWIRPPRDPNVGKIGKGETVVCPRPGHKTHEVRIVPGTRVTDVTLLSLLIQAGWNIRLYGPAGYGKSSLAEAAMVAAQAAMHREPLESSRARVVVMAGTTGVRDEAVVGRPTQDDEGRWVFRLAKAARTIRDGGGLVINEADLLGYVLKALNSPMEREALSLDAYEPGEPDVPTHTTFRAILTDNNDPQFPLEASVRSRLKLELSVCNPSGLGAMTVPATDTDAVVMAPTLAPTTAYRPVALSPALRSAALRPNPYVVTMVELLVALARCSGYVAPSDSGRSRGVGADHEPGRHHALKAVDARLTLLGLDLDDVQHAAAMADDWVPGRREIIAITQAERIVGTELALRAFITKCQLTGADGIARLLIDALWGDMPGADQLDLTPLEL
ncbi:AAA family ATPase [Conexibacter sp. JD483]|uniref:AAA family ATPase n=1 Tax=unclassified Conexibacter TaxID=2627773 RepID=UPI00271F7082|nr:MULTISPECIES: AAA family ATPase [unclassified Conexibacter]MDO8185822.1 AAA family ATPase [Conexibacter sp. CPCC 205706]MDO8198566.1 AAA family ATPase [Conexibacter sp. CPCC 205762]MDR9367652.1 AAA family ATPase [Conexibacter sp. JD483]